MPKLTQLASVGGRLASSPCVWPLSPTASVRHLLHVRLSVQEHRRSSSVRRTCGRVPFSGLLQPSPLPASTFPQKSPQSLLLAPFLSLRGKKINSWDSHYILFKQMNDLVLRVGTPPLRQLLWGCLHRLECSGWLLWEPIAETAYQSRRRPFP